MADEGGRGRGCVCGCGHGRGVPMDPPPPIQLMTVEQLIGMQAQLMQAMMDRLDNQPTVVPPHV